jgi:hypothetical protein
MFRIPLFPTAKVFCDYKIDRAVEKAAIPRGVCRFSSQDQPGTFAKPGQKLEWKEYVGGGSALV